MARIWYSVAGEGLGHAIRSQVIIDELRKEHEVMISAADRAYEYYKSRYDKVMKVRSHTYLYRKGKVLALRSFLRWWTQQPAVLWDFHRKVLPAMRRFKPDVLVSDLESNALYASRHLGVPVVSVDNNHALMYTDHGMKLNWYLPTIFRALYPTPSTAVILSVAPLKPSRPNVKVVPPILREVVTRARPSKKGHVLVYQTTPTDTDLLQTLSQCEGEFRVYGMNDSGDYAKNVVFRKFSESRFVEDLASARYVIMNASFTLLGEALYLGKPVICVPIKNQDEQELNGYLMERFGFGLSTYDLNPDTIRYFEEHLEKYRVQARKFAFDPHEGLKVAVDTTLGYTKK